MDLSRLVHASLGPNFSLGAPLLEIDSLRITPRPQRAGKKIGLVSEERKPSKTISFGRNFKLAKRTPPPPKKIERTIAGRCLELRMPSLRQLLCRPRKCLRDGTDVFINMVVGFRDSASRNTISPLSGPNSQTKMAISEQGIFR